VGTTYRDALSLVGAGVPGHLVADAEVPVLTGPQAQGDLLIYPVTPPDDVTWQRVPGTGAQVMHGEATGNTHWLHRGFDSPDVGWAPVDEWWAWNPWSNDDDPLTVGYLIVPAGQVALLIHTDEHGANGIGPGTYAINRKRELDPDLVRAREVGD